MDRILPWDRVFMLTLKRRPERLEHALRQCEKAGISNVEVFEGIDGHALPLPQGWAAGPGAYGCLESHRRIIERAILDGSTPLIMEDDNAFVDGFGEKLRDFMTVVPVDWDALFLSGQHMTPPTEVCPGVLKASGPDGIHRTNCYVLRGEYMKTMYSDIGGGMGHVDHVMGKTHAEHRVYAPSPWLAYQSADGGKSDISGRTPQENRFWNPKKIIKTGLAPGVPKKPCRGCGKIKRPV